MDVTLPDGTVINGVPDGTTKAELTNKLVANGYAKSIGGIQPNPTEGMSGMDKFLAGAGKGMTDIARGAGQLVGMGPSAAEVTQQRAQDKPLMQTGAGMAGNLAGQAAMTLPTMAIPGVNSYTGAALLGAGLGATQPVQSGMERAANTGLGAVSGIAGQGAGNLLSRALQPVKSTLNPEESRLAQVAQQEGIPLSAADITGSKPLKTLNSIFENLPFTAGPEAERRAAQAAAYNRAVMGKAGITGENLATPDVLATQKSNIGGQLGDIAERNSLDFNQGLTDRLATIVDDASKHLPPAKANEVASQVDQILSQVDHTGTMSGTNYQGWRQPLNALAKKGDEYSSYYGQIKRELDSAFRDQLPSAEVESFRDLSRQYANVKTIIPAMSGNFPNVIAGNVAPAQLGAALAQSIGREGKSLGRGDLNDLVRVGNLFVRDTQPNSGTPQRILMQGLLTGGGAGLGGGAALATGHDPLEGMMYGAAGTGLSLAGPRLVQSVVNNPAFQSYMVKQAGSPAATALAEALRVGGRTAGATLPLAFQP